MFLEAVLPLGKQLAGKCTIILGAGDEIKQRGSRKISLPPSGLNDNMKFCARGKVLNISSNQAWLPKKENSNALMKELIPSSFLR